MIPKFVPRSILDKNKTKFCDILVKKREFIFVDAENLPSNF